MKRVPAILGGTPMYPKGLPLTSTIGREERQGALRVLSSGILSDFVGHAGPFFLGGTEVLALEKEVREKFSIKHAVSFNSATTALEAAVAALELPIGSEVIVSPTTMSASMTAILVNNLSPIFTDIDRTTFCLDTRVLERSITVRTKAIMVTNLFGGAADYKNLKRIATKYKLKIIEDNAQAPGGKYDNKFLGSIGDIGVLSFNFHKVIHCGEGGMVITNSKEYAFRSQLKRNHGENALDDLVISNQWIIGSNYRMTELQAAIARAQLRKLNRLNRERQRLAGALTKGLRRIPGLAPCLVPQGSEHVYYVYPILFNAETFGVERDVFAHAMAEEGFPFNVGYQKPLYQLNLFTNPSLYKNLPWLKKSNYQRGRCPVAETLYTSELLLTNICRYPLTIKHIKDFLAAAENIQVYAQRIGAIRGKKV